MRACVVVIALAGCGRIDFDARTDGAAPGDAIHTRAGPCRSAPSIADTLTLAGETFSYTSFANDTDPFPGADVALTSLERDVVYGTTVSDGIGLYSLGVPAAGRPLAASLRYSRSGWWTTWVISDRPFDRDISGAFVDVWRTGLGPMWSDGSMGSVYGTLGATIDPGMGFLSISARDCAERPLEGVTFELSRSLPATSGYLAGDGVPSATQTTAPNAEYVAFNMEPGPLRIHAVKAGAEFLAVDTQVVAGSVATLVVMHSFD